MMKERDVMIACDFSTKAETMAFLDKFTEEKPYVKIGMELFYAEGPDMVREIKARGHKIFLDLKLHDIPNTVKKAMRNIALLDVDMTNVHAAGTIEMMKAAQEAIDEVGAHTKLIAVTQLTSTSEDRMRNELWIDHPLTETVQHYAHNAEIAGLAGVVCSPLEADLVHQVCGENFLTVTTPAKAREIGADYIVVGRSITASKDPVASYRRCVREFVEGE